MPVLQVLDSIDRWLSGTTFNEPAITNSVSLRV
jgi:hypothetical protein